jgi:transcriptional regulator with XRE-family HTH domain
VRNARLALGMRQYYVAAKVGVSATLLAEIENGRAA